MNINDAKIAAFDNATVPAGAVNERELYFVNNNLLVAGAHKCLTDAWFAYLRGAAYTGSISDMKLAYFRAIVLDSTLARPEAELAYWESLPT